MQGMFRANGGCGYVKKPDILLKVGPNNEVFDPNTTGKVKKTLKVVIHQALSIITRITRAFCYKRGNLMFIFNVQVKIYMGDGWHLEFHRTHFDRFSPPDFFTKVSYLL